MTIATKPLPFDVDMVQSSDHRDVVLKILNNTFDQFDPSSVSQKYNWLNELNPVGESLTYLLKDTDAGNYIGTNSICLREYVFKGSKLSAGTMIDFAVDKSYRSLGPAMQLLKKSTQSAAGKLDFLYGFPNPKAAPVFRRAGAKQLGETRRMVRVLRGEKYVKERLPSYLVLPVSKLLNCGLACLDFFVYMVASQSVKSQWDDVDAAELDKLWSASVPSYENIVITRRDSSVMSWRYDNGKDYRNLKTVLFRSAGYPVGYITFSSDSESIKVHDFFVLAPEAQLIRKIWRVFLWEVRKFKCSNVFVEFFGIDVVHRTLRHLGFVQREAAKIIIIPGQAKVPEDENSWYITGFDRDT